MKLSNHPLIIPERFNYIAVFLTLGCNYRCSYCINHFGTGRFSKKHLTGGDWVRGLNRIQSREDLPITLQGGEPSLHPDFIDIINQVRSDLHIDILTNIQFDTEEFIRRVDPDRLKRNAPYPSIRVSYHPQVMDLTETIEKTGRLQQAGFSIGIFGVLHPEYEDHILDARKHCLDLGIDFRTKEFLGEYEGRIHGTYKYPEAVRGEPVQDCLCRLSELIVGNSGDIYRCHNELYEGRRPIGHLLDPESRIEDHFRLCNNFGKCNPCDVKLKTDRFQVFGHASAEIRSVRSADRVKT